MSNCGNCLTPITGCGCSFETADTASVEWFLSGDGTLGDPWSLSGDVSGFTQESGFTLNISGVDTELGEQLFAFTEGYTISGINPPFGGGYETVNLNPVHLEDPNNLITYRLHAGTITDVTNLQITIYASTMDCTSKLKAVKNVVVNIGDSGEDIDLGAGGIGEWSIDIFGTGLDFQIGVAPSTVQVLANEPLCCITEMFIFWILGPI